MKAVPKEMERENQENSRRFRKDAAKCDAGSPGGRFEQMLKRVEPHWDDLLHQGSMVRKFSQRSDSPYVLQFRQKLTGARDGGQKRLYIGPKRLADEVMEEIWRRREESGTRYRRGRRPWRKDRRPLDEALAMTLEDVPAFKHLPVYQFLKRMAERDRELRERRTTGERDRREEDERPE